MAQEELKSVFKYIVKKCDMLINNDNHKADAYTQDIVEDIAELCNHILDGDYENLVEVKEADMENECMVDREIAREKSILDETKVEYFATGNPTIAAYSEDNLRNQIDAGADWMKEQMIRAFAKTLEVKEADFDKEIQNHIQECLDVKFPTTNIELIKKDVAYTAKKFFELGFKAAQKGE